MSEDDHQALPRRSSELVEGSILTMIIPSITVNIEEVLRGMVVERIDQGNASPISHIDQRHTLFFGKLLCGR